MAIVEVKVPQLSESVAEATLLQWKKRPGEAVAAEAGNTMVRTDGRNRRAAETRRKIIAAAKAMISETSVAPAGTTKLPVLSRIVRVAALGAVTTLLLGLTSCCHV